MKYNVDYCTRTARSRVELCHGQRWFRAEHCPKQQIIFPKNYGVIIKFEKLIQLWPRKHRAIEHCIYSIFAYRKTSQTHLFYSWKRRPEGIELTIKVKHTYDTVFETTKKQILHILTFKKVTQKLNIITFLLWTSSTVVNLLSFTESRLANYRLFLPF